MSLSPPSCPDRAGLARAHATRAGYPVNVGRKVLLYALANVARANATRANYTSGQAFVTIGGIQVGGGGTATPGSPRILHETLSISDTLNETPNTATCTLHFGNPTVGQAVTIRLGSINNQQLEFAGTILSYRSYYVDTPANPHFDLSLIDDTPGLNTRKIWTRAVGQTVKTIATALVSGYAADYTVKVDAAIGAIVIDQISVADRDLTDALSQLMKRAGSNWKCAYGKVVVIGPDGGPNPRIIDAVHPSLLDIDVTRDYSQVVTRVLSEGGGGNSLQQILPGETILPIDTTFWYEPSGTVTVGDQRLTYGAVDVGGGGSLVGPGAAPSAALVAQLASGSGVTSGVHDYAVGFVTASGESLQGPRTTITVGLLAPPAAPTAAALQPGTGPEVGVHNYAVSYVSSSGETIPGATLAVTTGDLAPPSIAPTTNTPTVGGSIDAGAHDYAVTFVTAAGETTPSPISGQQTTGGTITTAVVPPPSNAPTLGTAIAGTAIHSNNTYQWAQTFLNANGETTPSPVAARSQPPQTVSPPATAPTLTEAPFVAGQQWGLLTVTVGLTFYGETGETTIGPTSTLTFTSTTTTLNVSNIPLGPVGTVLRRIYYHENTRPNEIWFATIGDAVATALNTLPPPFASGSNSYSTTGQMGPPVNSDQIVHWNVPLTLQTGPAGVTGRRLYRTTETDGTLRRVATISDNTTTAYTDALSDSSLASQPVVPASNTATITGTANTIPLTAILVGDATVTNKRLYRRSGGVGLRLLATISAGATTYTDTAANASLGAAPPAANTAHVCQIPLTIPIGGPLVTARKVWGTAVGASQLKLIATVADNVTATYLVTTPDASLGVNAPTSNTATGNQVALSSIPIGAATVTARKIYRTLAGQSQLKLAITLADNTTTTALDTLADGSLGANAPTSDTSALQQPSGSVLAGSTSLIVAGVGAFRTTGGWAVIGNGEQVIRYSGLTGSALTGVPGIGVGAITATISYNSTITAAPQLTGVPSTGSGAVLFSIPRGEPINLLVTENDVPAQTALAALLATARPGFDGVQEDSISDNRLSATEARARARAWLAVRKDVEVSVHAVTRDRNSQSGRTLTVNLGIFNLASVPFTIQSVTENAFEPALNPHFTIQASSVRFSFEDWQRMLKEGL
jgi:hypothetical protein